MITRLWWSLLRINAIVSKELRQLSRDRITFGMIVMIPLIQLLLFGYAINTNVRNVPTAIVDQSHSATEIGRASCRERVCLYV